MKDAGGHLCSREITIVTMSGGTPSRGLWIYFLLMINSLGIFNFLAYGYSERWFSDMKNVCGFGNGTIGSSHTESRMSVVRSEI